MCSAGARLSSQAVRAAAKQYANKLKSTSHEHSKQRGTCHSESSSAPTMAVHHSACWNENTAPPQPLPVSSWQSGDWCRWRHCKHTHTHTLTQGDGCLCDESWLAVLPSFRQGPVSKDPHRLNPLTFTRKHPIPLPPLSVHLFFFTPLWNKATLKQSRWEYQFRLNILSLKYLHSVPNPEWPACHKQDELNLYNNVWAGCRLFFPQKKILVNNHPKKNKCKR